MTTTPGRDRPRLSVVRDHGCRPDPTCDHNHDWTCTCGQRWLRAGSGAWVNAGWLTHVRVITEEPR